MIWLVVQDDDNKSNSDATAAADRNWAFTVLGAT